MVKALYDTPGISAVPTHVKALQESLGSCARNVQASLRQSGTKDKPPCSLCFGPQIPASDVLQEELFTSQAGLMAPALQRVCHGVGLARYVWEQLR